MVGLRTVVRPGSDAAVLRIEKPGGGWVHVAMTLDGNGRWCAQDPREGSKALVAEAWQEFGVCGGGALGLTDNLNYGIRTIRRFSGSCGRGWREWRRRVDFLIYR